MHEKEVTPNIFQNKNNYAHPSTYLSDHENKLEYSVQQTIDERPRRFDKSHIFSFGNNQQYTINTLTINYYNDQRDNKQIARELKNTKYEITEM